MNHNKSLGDFGEALAKEYLMKKGYKIIDNNVRVGKKEIDIVAYYKKNLIFVEVKTRKSRRLGTADETIFAKKEKSLKRAISLYLYRRNKIKYRDARLDLIAIDIDPGDNSADIKHYEGIA